ncbi:hypothetical protein J6590_023690 [Homalodisca vitripennis]|nr:hypothetical protein J6590_023690 [Homalodisca vitripennis]
MAAGSVSYAVDLDPVPAQESSLHPAFLAAVKLCRILGSQYLIKRTLNQTKSDFEFKTKDSEVTAGSRPSLHLPVWLCPRTNGILAGAGLPTLGKNGIITRLATLPDGFRGGRIKMQLLAHTQHPTLYNQMELIYSFLPVPRCE